LNANQRLAKGADHQLPSLRAADRFLQNCARPED